MSEIDVRALEVVPVRRPVGSLHDIGVEPDWSDPEFCELYERYLNTYRRYLIQLSERRKLRLRYAQKRKTPLRPLGSPPDYKLPAVTRRRPVEKSTRRPFKVNLGSILGWVTFIENSFPLPDDAEPEMKELHGALWDKLQLQHFHAAKRKYQDAKMALARYQNRKRKARAKDQIDHMSNMQLLGCEGDMEAEMQKVQEEVALSCEAALQMYDSDPRPGTLRYVFENIVDAQLVGLDEGHPVVEKFDTLLDKLRAAGKL